MSSQGLLPKACSANMRLITDYFEISGLSPLCHHLSLLGLVLCCCGTLLLSTALNNSGQSFHLYYS